MENRSGELVIPVAEERFGDALFSFVQALTKVTDVSFLNQCASELQRHSWKISRHFLDQRCLKIGLRFDWFDERHDPVGKYTVDARINRMRRPLSRLCPARRRKGARCDYITANFFEKWKLPFQSMAIFENQDMSGVLCPALREVHRCLRKGLLKFRRQTKRPHRCLYR